MRASLLPRPWAFELQWLQVSLQRQVPALKWLKGLVLAPLALPPAGTWLWPQRHRFDRFRHSLSARSRRLRARALGKPPTAAGAKGFFSAKISLPRPFGRFGVCRRCGHLLRNYDLRVLRLSRNILASRMEMRHALILSLVLTAAIVKHLVDSSTRSELWLFMSGSGFCA